MKNILSKEKTRNPIHHTYHLTPPKKNPNLLFRHTGEVLLKSLYHKNTISRTTSLCCNIFILHSMIFTISLDCCVKSASLQLQVYDLLFTLFEKSFERGRNRGLEAGNSETSHMKFDLRLLFTHADWNSSRCSNKWQDIFGVQHEFAIL